MYCVSKKGLVVYVALVVSILFVIGTAYIQTQKRIFENKAASPKTILAPSPAPYPTEYGVNFEVPNTQLKSVANLEQRIYPLSDFNTSHYSYTIPVTFRLGIHARKNEDAFIQKYYFQTDLTNYPNMLKDAELLRYFNPDYPKLSDKVVSTGGLPVQNFCHLATLANSIVLLGGESVLSAKLRTQLKTDTEFLTRGIEAEKLTLPELLFYSYYRTTSTGTRTSYITSNGGNDAGLVLSIGLFVPVVQRAMDDLNSLDPNIFKLSVMTPDGLIDSSISHKRLSTFDDVFSGSRTIMIARGALNGSRDLLGAFTYTKGPTHYFLIGDSQSYFYPPVITAAQPNSVKRTALFIVDPLGSVDHSTTIDAHGYGGIGYIGWTGMYYFFGGRPKTYAPTTSDINAMQSRDSGIYNIIQITNTGNVVSPSPRVPPPQWKKNGVEMQ